MARSPVRGLVKGERELIRTLDRITDGARNRVHSQVVRAGGSVISKAAKRKVPKESKALHKSIGVVTRKRKAADTAVAVIGPRRGKKYWQPDLKPGGGVYLDANGWPRYRKPTRYAHLVELGSPNAKAQPFLRPAANSTKSSQRAAMARIAAKAITREAERHARRQVRVR